MSKWSLKWRMVLPIGVILALDIFLIVLFMAINFSGIASNMANEQLEASSYRYANSIKGDFDQAFGVANSLASIIHVGAAPVAAERQA